MRRFYLCFFIPFIIQASRAAEIPVYETVVSEKSAPEILSDDSFLPSVETSISKAKSKGNIARDLETATCLTVKTTGSNPGSLSSFNGLGRSAEEVGFQSLGVPLNPPQGGGFDLSSFPGYLWSKAKYQSGGVGGAYDPRASVATVSLTPWSSDAMNLEGPGVELFVNNSSARLIQTAAGAHFQKENVRSALLVGNSEGLVRGPAATFSLGVGSLKAHFLGTDQTAELKGSQTHPTPKAEQRTVRAVPVLEYGTFLGADWRLQTTAFYDVGYIRLEDPENPFSKTRDHFTQLGGVFASTHADTRLGGGYRKVEYSGLSFEAPSQSIFHLLGAHLFRSGSFSFEPEAKIVGDQSVGALPEGSLAFRKSFSDSPISLFSRVTYSNELPSLQNRYYKSDDSFYQFAPNTDLKTEKMISPILGAEVVNGVVSASLEGSAQFRRDTQIIKTSFDGFKQVDHPINSGDGYLYSVRERSKVSLSKELSITENIVWATSFLSESKQPFPYQRKWMGSLTGTYRFVDFTFRGASDAYVTDATRVPAYGLWDLGVHGSMYSGLLEASLQVENVFNRVVEFVHDYPNSGRIVSMSLTGKF